MERTRDEYLAWAKKRALEYLDQGDIESALASMGSDLNQHEEFKKIANELTPVALLYVIEHDIEGARRWIEGFR